MRRAVGGLVDRTGDPALDSALTCMSELGQAQGSAAASMQGGERWHGGSTRGSVADPRD